MEEEIWEEVNPMDVPIWEPKEVGDEIIGIFEQMEENVGPNKSRLYTLRKDDGSLIKVWGSTLLDKRFDFIQLGEKVKIVYQGKKKSQKGGREYHDFKLYHTKAKHLQNKLEEDENIPVIEEEEINEEPPF